MNTFWAFFSALSLFLGILVMIEVGRRIGIRKSK